MSDTQLIFEVTHQLIHRVDKFKPIADSKNYLYAHVDFLTSEWDGKIGTVIFTKDNISYKMLLDTNNDCEVPWELIEGGGDVYVSVYSGDLITTNTSRVTIGKSGYVEDAENSQEPTPEMYAQIISSIEDLGSDLADLRQDLLILDGGSTDWTEG